MLKECAVIGLGRFGEAVARALVQGGCTVVAVDQDRNLVQHLADVLQDAVAADATDEGVLRQLGVAEFPVGVVAIGSDLESSILVVAGLRELGVKRIIAKAPTRRQANILRKVGADEVVLPEAEAGERLGARLLRPSEGEAFQLETGIPTFEWNVRQEWAGQSLLELELRRMGILVVAIDASAR